MAEKTHCRFSIFNFQFHFFALVLCVLCFVLFFYRLGDRDLWSSHEGRAAQDAQSILLDHQWGLPRLFDRKIELQKPPLYYWLVAVTTLARGGSVDAWTVRFPAALAGLGGVVLLYAFGLLRDRKVAGLIAAAVLATAVHYTWLARVGRIDMLLSLMVAIAVICFFLGQIKGTQLVSGVRPKRAASPLFVGWAWFALGYLATALAVLFKGPIGFVLPAAVAGVFLLVEGELSSPLHLRRWLKLAHHLGLWWGLPLILAIVLPWFLWANEHTHGQFFDVFFWKHNFERGFGGGALKAHPWWFYGPQLFLDWLPWSPLLPVFVWLLMRKGRWREDPEARLGLVWVMTILAILSCAQFKRADYLLPAYPGAALFLGCVAERVYATMQYKKSLLAVFGSTVAAVALGWWLHVDYILPQEEPSQEFRRFAEEIRSRVPAPQLVLFFRAEAHALAFHVGPPIDTILEWENLDVWAARPESWYVVMPPETAEEWPQYLKSGRLEEVLRNTDLNDGKHAHPLVLMRTRPGAGPPEKVEIENRKLKIVN